MEQGGKSGGKPTTPKEKKEQKFTFMSEKETNTKILEIGGDDTIGTDISVDPYFTTKRKQP